MNDTKKNSVGIVRFGLIGAGGISQAYSAAISEMTDAKLVAVTDTNLTAAIDMAAEHDAVAFETLDAMISGCELDAVIVCTPPLYHPEHCITLLDKGIHVLCEKPLAIDSSSAVMMVQAAENGNAIFTMASKFRFVDDIKQAKEFVESGKLGKIILFENCFSGKVDMTKRWNSEPEVSGGGVLIDNGTHSLDIMRYLLGNLSEIQVVEGARVQQMQVEDTVHVFVRAESGAMGSIDLSWSMHKPSDYFISLYGLSLIHI